MLYRASGMYFHLKFDIVIIFDNGITLYVHTPSLFSSPQTLFHDGAFVESSVGTGTLCVCERVGTKRIAESK